MRPLDYKEALYLATQGGSDALGLGDQIGDFTPGKWFDAVVVDGSAIGSNYDVFSDDSVEDRLSKFVMLGDDRNVLSVYVAGACKPVVALHDGAREGWCVQPCHVPWRVWRVWRVSTRAAVSPWRQAYGRGARVLLAVQSLTPICTRHGVLLAPQVTRSIANPRQQQPAAAQAKGKPSTRLVGDERSTWRT